MEILNNSKAIEISLNSTPKNIEKEVSGPIIEEEPWTDNIEKLVLKWKYHASRLSELHEKAGYLIKFKHNLFGLPPVFIPLIMTFITQIIPEGSESIVSGGMFLVSGISGAIYKWLNLGEQYALHFQYAARYDDIITSIDSELSRQKRFRRAADAFVTEIRAKIDNLNQTSPEFPMCHYNCNCCNSKNFDDDDDDNDNYNNDNIVITIN